MGGRRKIFKIKFLSVFIFSLLVIISIHLISSNFAVIAQKPHILFSEIPENFIALFVNNQSSLSNTTTDSTIQNSSSNQTQNEESMGIEVLEDLPRGSTRIEDLDNQSETDVLISDNQLEYIQNIVENGTIVSET
ncbi:MAG: hypothetical protein ACE5SW_09130 [Nitrososphaeraceae archaeon]